MEGTQEPMQNVEQEILAIRDSVAVMGANDSEIPNLNRLVERLHSGEITPAEALSEAHRIENRKASYH